MMYVTNWVFWCFYVFRIVASASKPNIVVIIADDLGWNDVGFHGSDEIPTPNIDALAYNGIILNRHYVLPTCTPSRASFITGKYPIRTGLQGDPGRGQEPWGLPLKEKILPQYLKEHGYKTHLIGKWHLGFSKTSFTPTHRGFDSHFGYYNGWIRYNDSSTSSYPYSGIDARRNLKPAGDEFRDQYATDVFTKEAVNLIKNHNPETPLFLELSHVAVHAIKGDILQVRDEEKNDEDFSYIADKKRRLFAGALKALDESVGNVVEALKEADLLDNSIILFISDNGGPTEDPAWRFASTASNWPLRGMKTSFYEGGVRGAAAIWSPLFERRSYVSNEIFHISDWLPTFVSAAGGDSNALANLDGINQWDLLIGNQLKTNRTEVLININSERSISSIIKNNWKLIKHDKSFESTFADKYAGSSGREKNLAYDLDSVLTSTTNHLIGNTESTTANKFLELRSQAKLDSKCESRIASELDTSKMEGQDDYLYDVENDPCEFSNKAEEYPDLVTELKARLAYYESITVPQQRLPIDSRADPSRSGGYWGPWLDESGTSTSSAIIQDALVFSVTFLVFKKIGSMF